MPQSCPNCRRPIRWLLTKMGERIPVDRDPVLGGVYLPSPEGRIERVESNPDVIAYTPHFMTCKRSYLAPKRARKSRR